MAKDPFVKTVPKKVYCPVHACDKANTKVVTIPSEEKKQPFPEPSHRNTALKLTARPRSSLRLCGDM